MSKKNNSGNKPVQKPSTGPTSKPDVKREQNKGSERPKNDILPTDLHRGGKVDKKK